MLTYNKSEESIRNSHVVCVGVIFPSPSVVRLNVKESSRDALSLDMQRQVPGFAWKKVNPKWDEWSTCVKSRFGRSGRVIKYSIVYLSPYPPKYGNCCQIPNHPDASSKRVDSPSRPKDISRIRKLRNLKRDPFQMPPNTIRKNHSRKRWSIISSLAIQRSKCQALANFFFSGYPKSELPYYPPTIGKL